MAGRACASLSATRAQQQKKVARVGFLITGSLESPEGRSALDAFKQGLSQLGHIGMPHRLRFPIRPALIAFLDRLTHSRPHRNAS
jgi:hypothetical protein